MTVEQDWTERRSSAPTLRPRSDHRSVFGRDRARIIHCAALRRLQAKTQVLGIGEGDFHRTRLTHSMEVAQVGRGIVRFLEAQEPKSSERREWIPSLDLIEAISLAHDIGHPPFGHGGEVALNYLMRNAGGFEGNGQSLRLLSRLEAHTKGFGLDPTRRTLLGVLKYPVPLSKVVRRSYPMANDEQNIRADDWKPPKCYLDTEQDVVDWVLNPFTAADRERFQQLKRDRRDDAHGRPGFKSFDTSIMELADDISYGVHDFEDAIALRLVTRDDWNSTRGAFDEVWGRIVDIQFDDYADRLFGADSSDRKQAIGGLVNAFIISTRIRDLDLFSHPLLNLNAEFEIPAINFLEALKGLVVARVIKTTSVQTLEYRGQRLIINLFTTLASDPERLLKDSFRAAYLEANDSQHARRVVCDYLAGMTDEYATRLYERLFIPRHGNTFDRL